MKQVSEQRIYVWYSYVEAVWLSLFDEKCVPSCRASNHDWSMHSQGLGTTS